MVVDIFRKILPHNVKQVIKKLILTRLSSCIFRINFAKKVRKRRSFYKELIFIVATPQHNNLGDHAIVYAELKFLKDMGMAERVIEIPNTDYLTNKEFIRKYVSIEDLLIIDGGGSMGTLWPMEDDKISEIIDSYSDNAIIVFPQTCYYKAGIESDERLMRSKHIYQRAKKLVIALRDQRSYEFCITNFPNVTFIRIPDIVLYLNRRRVGMRNERKGVLLCFRSDLEKVISDTEIERIKDYLDQQCINYNEVSTMAKRSVSKKQRNAELFKKWNEFASTRLVITDRLHGMIFAAITGTPCLAIDNLSQKVSGVYNLMPDFSNIVICKNVNDILKYINTYYDIEANQYFSEGNTNEYQQLKDIIFNKMNL